MQRFVHRRMHHPALASNGHVDDSQVRRPKAVTTQIILAVAASVAHAGSSATEGP
jgi:hypothetical protein